jgi:hypothetical protein
MQNCTGAQQRALVQFDLGLRLRSRPTDGPV